MSSAQEKFTRQTITHLHTWTPNLFSFRCTRDAGFRFTAGQFARLGVRKASGAIVWRGYSMVSSPFDEFLEFFSIVVPGGEFTSELSKLEVGDEILIEKQAHGFLTLDRFVDGDNLWLLATGTGLAPFLSMLQDFEIWQRFEQIVLVYSVRSESELAYRDLLDEILSREYVAEYAHKFTFVPVVTREEVPGSLGVRITDLLVSGELEKHVGLPMEAQNSRVLICGNPEMVEDCRMLLQKRDMQLSMTRRPGAVAVENYW
ncbi:ferredoxin--NADP reductase [Pseudomonas sp. C27(2019)]|uniref:ferredoxin--NADP reductase n=1 Tax=Pseudomonas sp. C27(2019) TaxID=2604941 RepID=UPI001243AE5B|nr:ferredoxin--NADP reductase [Pseudomonas sp. C27(2019)]QEY59344.1 ferredoxin--NADP reductase [Pseudomonas sp. C27(2019)]